MIMPQLPPPRSSPSKGTGAIYGGYGIMAITGACGALNPSSILGSRPAI